MYKHHDGAHLVGHGGVLCLVGTKLVGSHEGTSDHDRHAEGQRVGQRCPPVVS